jgi:hypothetical protein
MRTRTGLAPLFAVLLAGCLSHRVASEPIEIKPIHITMDINLKVQRELEEFFDFEETAGPGSVEADSQRAKEGK